MIIKTVLRLVRRLSPVNDETTTTISSGAAIAARSRIVVCYHILLDTLGSTVDGW